MSFGLRIGSPGFLKSFSSFLLIIIQARQLYWDSRDSENTEQICYFSAISLFFQLCIL